MKTNKITFLAILLSVLVSCNDKDLDIPTGITGLTEEVYYEQVGEVNSIGSVEHYELLLQKATESNADDDAFLKYVQEQLKAAEEIQEECINQSGANTNWEEGTDGAGNKNRALGYKFATIRYKSIDQYNNPIMLSTLVVWPFNNLIPDPDANNVVIGCHVTYGSNAERPTNYDKNSIMSDVGMLACCARSALNVSSDYDNLVIIPDYQGFGATHGEVHPYLSQDLTARQVLDGVRAGIAFYEETHDLEDDWRSISTGYSQGGSVAMAVHKYIEENNLTSEFRFAGSVCGSGPYDPLATLQKYAETDQVYMPVAAAMMMYSMCNTNPRLMGKYSPEDFLSDKFINSGIIRMIQEKALITDEMQEALLQHSVSYKEEDEHTLCMHRLATDGLFHPYRSDTKDKWSWKSGYIRTAWARTVDLLQDDCLNYFHFYYAPKTPERIEAMQSLRAALEDNILYKDWKPIRPIFLYHTEEDEVVPIENYQNCLKAWEGMENVKGIIYKGTTETHVSYGSYFFMRQCGKGICAIFDNKVSDYNFQNVEHGIL